MSVFSKFLAKHSADLHNIGSALDTIFRALPMSREDRDKVQGAIKGVTDAAANVGASVAAVAKATDVKVSKADVTAAVKAAVAEALPGLVAELVKDHLTANKSPDEQAS